jgi:hypothetical protein
MKETTLILLLVTSESVMLLRSTKTVESFWENLRVATGTAEEAATADFM